MAGQHKQLMIAPGRRLKQLGFKLLATNGTARVLNEAGLEVGTVKKLHAKAGDSLAVDAVIMEFV